GIHDNFFEVGGHSLLATQLISRMRDHFAFEIPLRLLFQHPTVAELAQALSETSVRKEPAGITRLERSSRRAPGDSASGTERSDS
ncbi:MAG: phosphopantetheine-binding protein, partial [Acidobacteriota bacterium]